MKLIHVSTIVLASTALALALILPSIATSQSPPSGDAPTDPNTPAKPKPEPTPIEDYIKSIGRNIPDGAAEPQLEELDAPAIRARIAELMQLLDTVKTEEERAVLRRDIDAMQAVLARDGDFAKWVRITGGRRPESLFSTPRPISQYVGARAAGAEKTFSMLESKDGVLMLDSRVGDTWILRATPTPHWEALPRITTPSDRIVVLPSPDTYRQRDPDFMRRLLEKGGVEGVKADWDAQAAKLEEIKKRWDALQQQHDLLERDIQQVLTGK
jgi:hypothetical protein